MIMGNFSSSLFELKCEGHIKGLWVAQGNLRIEHISFVDDTILFSESEDKISFQYLLKGVGDFKQASRHHINLHKSETIGINVDPTIIEDEAKKNGCKMGEWLNSYMGLPLAGVSRIKAFWLQS